MTLDEAIAIMTECRRDYGNVEVLLKDPDSHESRHQVVMGMDLNPCAEAVFAIGALYAFDASVPKDPGHPDRG